MFENVRTALMFAEHSDTVKKAYAELNQAEQAVTLLTKLCEQMYPRGPEHLAVSVSDIYVPAVKGWWRANQPKTLRERQIEVVLPFVTPHLAACFDTPTQAAAKIVDAFNKVK